MILKFLLKMRDEDDNLFKLNKATKKTKTHIATSKNFIRELAVNPNHEIYVAKAENITGDATGLMQYADKVKIIRLATKNDILQICEKDKNIVYPKEPLSRVRKSKQIENCLKKVVDSLPKNVSELESLIASSMSDIDKIKYFLYFDVYTKNLKTKINIANKYERATVSAYIMSFLGAKSKDIYFLNDLLKLGCVLSYKGKEWIALGKDRQTICSYKTKKIVKSDLMEF